METGKVPVQHVLDHHHGVVAFFHGLPVEVLCQLGEVLVGEPDGHRDVLLRGRELVADLEREEIVEL